jgi:hypothetical protein
VAKAKRPNRKVDNRACCPVIWTEPSVLVLVVLPLFPEAVPLLAVSTMLGSEAPSVGCEGDVVQSVQINQSRSTVD